MKKGEVGILAVIGVVVVVAASIKGYNITSQKEEDKGIPYYSTATQELSKQARVLFDKYNCHACHSLWTKRSVMQSVPAPALDGMGSLKSEEWFLQYFSADNPQAIVPTRLKKEYQMPSLADAPKEDRIILAKYMASLKVEDWYLEETKKREYEKLTGQEYSP
ncbi:MAG: cytochrome c [Gammaproteobacteria bacterium]|nr:cytochrome c [Gammaproteobacteria bacterium]